MSVKFTVVNAHGGKEIVTGDKFTITDESHLVITDGEDVIALFAAGRWNSVQKHSE